MKMIPALISALFIWAGPLHAATVANLRCEYLKDPLGVDVAKPRFGWIINSDQRGEVQTAYRIEVFRDGKTVWDSGKVASSETAQVEYGGPPLAADTAYTWQIRSWDQTGSESAPSAPASFATGLLTPEDWKAHWVARRPEDEWRKAWDARRAAEAKDMPHWGNSRNPMDWLLHDPGPKNDPAPLLRKGFTVDKAIREARLFVTGVGNYQLFLNGKRIDGGALAPGFTDYNKHVLYNTYDVASVLRQGPNALGLILGRGWYNEIIYEVWDFARASWVGQPKAIAQLSITYEDGSHDTVISDETWKVTDGPLLFDDLRGGEVYDATREIPGWSEAAFDDSAWSPASVVPAPKGTLRAELMEPMLPTAEFKAIKVTSLNTQKTESVEVTQKLKDAVKDNTLSIVAGNAAFGEAAPGKVKTLRVKYSLDGQTRTVEATENARLEIKGGDGSLTILKADYGDLPAENSWLFTFPQDVSGHAKLHIDGSGLKGRTIHLGTYTFQYADGRLLGGQDQYYICRGDRDETVELQFTYFGARLVLVNGLNYQPKPEDMTLIQRRSAIEDAGTFETSDPLLNQLQSNIRWTEASAMHSLPQDCWTREKLGWTGDTKATAEVAIFNFGMASLYTKYLMDHRDNQSSNGDISAYVPNHSANNESVTWVGTVVVLPWLLYEYYGDTRILAENYDAAARYLHAADQVKPHLYFGGPADWCPPWAKTADQIPDDPELGVPVGTFPSDPEGNLVYGTAHYFQLAQLMARIAGILGKTDDVAKWNNEAAQVNDAFNKNFFDSATGIYHGDKPTDYRQAANAHALWLGLVPENRRREVLDNLVGDIVARQGGHLDTGILGTQALFEALPEADRSDVAYEMALQKTYPGYLWPILHFGLTSLPEHWEGFGTHEHPMFGSVDAFFYKRLAGILPDPAAPGFAHFKIKPSIDNPLTFVKSSYDSIRGMIRSEWHKQGGTLTLSVEIPANTTADVLVPKFGYGEPSISISESGKPVWTNGAFSALAGCTAAQEVGDAIQFSVGSGRYDFTVTSGQGLASGRDAGVSLAVPDTVVFPGETAEVKGTVVGSVENGALSGPRGGLCPGLDSVKVDQSLAGNSFAIEVSVSATQRVWRVLYLPIALTGQSGGKDIEVRALARLLVRPSVEIRYPLPSLLALPNYTHPHTLFYVRNERTHPMNIRIRALLPPDWQFSLVQKDGSPVSLPPQLAAGANQQVTAIVTPPLNVTGGSSGTAHFLVSDGATQVADVAIPWICAVKMQESLVDDFQGHFWSADNDLKVEKKNGGVLLSKPVGTAALTSDWLVMDFSRPLEVGIKVDSVSPGGKWALYIEDANGFNSSVQWDNSQVGLVINAMSSLPWKGPHRFRMKLYCINGEVSLDSISIHPKK